MRSRACSWLSLALLPGCLLTSSLDRFTRDSDEPSAASSGGSADCPADMVEVPDEHGGAFCIDARETTVAEYQAFLHANPSTDGQPDVCSWNQDFAPAIGGSCDTDALMGPAALPITCVDWCDARAYCVWKGRRMCGRLGSGDPNPDGETAHLTSEWYAACSKGNTRTYPYEGDSYDGGEYCNSTQPGPVDGTQTLCEGGYPGLFNMSGNVAEWDDTCGPSVDDVCAVRGGAFWSGSPVEKQKFLRCDGAQAVARTVFSNDRGVRCCR